MDKSEKLEQLELFPEYPQSSYVLIMEVEWNNKPPCAILCNDLGDSYYYKLVRTSS